MRVVFSCPTCVAALLAASLAVSAQVILGDYNHHRPRWIDPYHRVSKEGPVTAAPEYSNAIREGHVVELVKRGQTCDAGYHLCAESLSGGCCPERYECATDSCFAATANPQTWTCGGNVGWYPCEDLGCCPVGMVCAGADSCSSPAGSSTTCPDNYYLCPASMSYGCCKSGYACGTAVCSAISTTTATYTATVTSTGAGETTEFESVFTTTMIPTVLDVVPTSYADSDDAQQPMIEKFFPSATQKRASRDDGQSDNDSGTPVALIGGVVGGGVFLVICVVIGIIWVRYRLKRNETVMETEKSRSSRPSYLGAKTEADSATNTPNGTDTPRAGRNRGASTSSVGLAGAANTTPGVASTPDANISVFGQPSSTSAAWGEPGVRQPSIDSSTGTTSYFDPQRISAQTAPSGYRYSTDSAAGHGRQWSIGSTGEPYVVITPQELGGKQLVPELYGGDSMSPSSAMGSSPGTLQPHGGASPLSPNLAGLSPSTPDGGRRRSGSASARPPLSHLNHARRRSDGTSTGHARGRSDSSSTSGGPNMLDVVTETSGEGYHMHGFYGPNDRQVGQTAVGLRTPEQRSRGPSTDRGAGTDGDGDGT